MSSLNYLLRVQLGSSAQEVSTSNSSSTTLLTGMAGGGSSSTASLLKMTVEDTNKLKKQVIYPSFLFLSIPLFAFIYLYSYFAFIYLYSYFFFDLVDHFGM